jgi:MarR family 2-MHQ and catechol resistance regulon transcriptional repressor
MAGLDEIRSREGYAAHSAELYARAFDWADEKSIEASLSVNAAHTAQLAAMARMQTALGVNRTMGRHALLRLLHFANGHRMTQFEIANEMQVTSSNITFLVDGLEKDTLVQRMPHPTDRRTVYVQLTAEGEALAAVIVPSMARFMGCMLDGFSDDEKQQLSSLLDRFRRNAEQFDAKALD